MPGDDLLVITILRPGRIIVSAAGEWRFEPVVATSAAWSDGTFWDDGTAWED